MIFIGTPAVFSQSTVTVVFKRHLPEAIDKREKGLSFRL
jgi:hypothetical protein